MQHIGSYHLESELGTGGSGTVYRATHPVLKRPIAIKVLHDALVHDGDARERFLREAQVTLDLRHSGIIRLYDIEQRDQQLYLVMEFVPNGSLADAMRRRRFTPVEALELCADVADALAYAHRMGVVHRDVKPSNVLLRADGSPVVTDFGIALDRATMTAALAEAGLSFGTVAYCAPEQLEGRAGDARTDVYALGVMLFELVAGRLPFAGSSDEIVYQHLCQPSPRLATLDPTVPPALDILVDCLLAKDPAQRPPDMDTVAATLRVIARQWATPAAPGATGVAGSSPLPDAGPVLPAVGVTTRITAPHAPLAPSPYRVPSEPPTPTPPALWSQHRAAAPPTVARRRALLQDSAARGLLMMAIMVMSCGGAVWWLLSARPRPNPVDAFPPMDLMYPAPQIAAGYPAPPGVELPVETLAKPPQRTQQFVWSGEDRWSIANVGVYHDGPDIRVLGVVRNAGSRTRANATVRVVLRDRGGNEVASRETPIQQGVLAPGSASGFAITLDAEAGTLPAADSLATRFEVRSDAAAATGDEPSQTPAIHAVITQHAGQGYVVRATLRDGDPDAGATRVHAVVFDARGTVIDLTTLAVDRAGMAQAIVPYIAPGGPYPAPAPVRELAGTITDRHGTPAGIWLAFDAAVLQGR